MFRFGNNKKEQICGFIIISDKKESKKEYRDHNINQLKSAINSSGIDSMSDMNVLKDEIEINKLKNSEKRRIYIPIEYYSEKDSVSNRRRFRDKLTSKDNISVIYNKKAHIK